MAGFGALVRKSHLFADPEAAEQMDGSKRE